MKKIKKCLCVFVAVIMLLTLLAGCAGTGPKYGKNRDALTILVRNNVIEEKLQEKFPDIPFEFSYYDGKNATTDLQMRVKNHDITDIYMGTLPLNKEDAEANLIDLSGYPFCENFEPSILNQCDIDGHIYQIPTAITVRCIIYNKEMFRKYGWKEPRNFGELAALCRQINDETEDITPIVFGGAGVGYYFTMMTTFAQTEFLYTSEGEQWEKEYFAGEANAEKGFGKGIQMTQELIDAGAFDIEKNAGLWDVEVFETRMKTGEAAMQFAWGSQNRLFGMVDKESEKYAVMPFRNYAGDGFLGTGGSYYIGLSNNLKEKGNEKKLENALRVMEWFSTEEGQQAINPTDGSMIYPLKASENEHVIPQFRELWYENLDDIKAPMLYVGYEDILIQAAEYIIDSIEGKHDLSGLSSYIDDLHQAALKENTENKDAYLGTFASDFTHEETIQTMAVMLHSRGDSDITLVSDGSRIGSVRNAEGIHSKFYEGTFPRDWITVMLPGKETMDNQVVQMKLSGAQIQELLEKGKNMALFEDEVNTKALAKPENAINTQEYPYYWAGMTVEMKDGKVISMVLADGTPIEQDTNYTVSFVDGDYMDTTEAAGKPVELGYTVTEIVSEYMQDNSPVSPEEPVR